MKNPYYNNIVTPVDFNDFTELIVEQSYQIATLFNCVAIRLTASLLTVFLNPVVPCCTIKPITIFSS